MNRANSAHEQVTSMWNDIVRADQACDAAEIARLLPLLLARDDRIESLAHVEQYFRAENYNARLVAATLSPQLLARRFKSLDPRRPTASAGASAAASTSTLAYYVSVNVEGAESAAREQRAHGATSEQANRERLAHHCGFLVLEGDATSLLLDRDDINDTPEKKEAIIQFGTDQQVQTFQSLAGGIRVRHSAGLVCCACRRLGNSAIELRPLTCCSTLCDGTTARVWCCSHACFERHVESVHDAPASETPGRSETVVRGETEMFEVNLDEEDVSSSSGSTDDSDDDDDHDDSESSAKEGESNNDE